MVSIIDRIGGTIRRVLDFTGIGQDTVEEIRRDIQQTRDFIGEKSQQTSGSMFTRKYVSGLFYCGGEKVQYFGLTFEQNGEDRYDELLDAIEKVSRNTCSDIRDDFGYEAREVDSSEVRMSAIWPDIEVGQV